MSDQQPEQDTQPAPAPPPAGHVPLIQRMEAFEQRAIAIEQRLSQLTGLHNTFVEAVLRELGL